MSISSKPKKSSEDFNGKYERYTNIGAYNKYLITKNTIGMKQTGEKIIEKFMERAYNKSLEFYMFSVLTGLLLIISSIFTVRVNQTLFNVNVALILVEMFIFLFYIFAVKFTFTSEFCENIAKRYLSLNIYAINTGVKNMPPVVLEFDNWLGVIARKHFYNHRLSKTQAHAFYTLSNEWNDSLISLLRCVKTI